MILVYWLLLLAQIPSIPFIRPGHPSGAAPVTNPSLTFTAPTSDSVFNTSVVAQVLGGTATVGSNPLDRVTITCSGATTVAETNATGTTSWAIAVEFSVGTTACTAKVYDTATGTAQVSKQFVVTSPDAEDPVVNAGTDFSTALASVVHVVDCTDDVECTAVTWSNALGGSGSCGLSGNGLERTADCTIALVATGDLTTANTITVTGVDGSGHDGTDQVVITRTVALEITTASFGACTEDAACNGKSLAARGGTTGSYTFTNNGAGTTLNDADAQCAGLVMPASWNGSSTTWNAQAAANRTPTEAGTCSFTAKVEDGVTSATKALTVTITASGASSYFSSIAALTESLAVTGCTSTGDAKGCSLQNSAQITALLQGGNDYNGREYDATENAAKHTWPQEEVNGGQGLRMPVTQTSGTFLFIWDFKPGLSWASVACGGAVDPAVAVGYGHKEFQVGMSPQPAADDFGSISIEPKTDFAQGGVTLGQTCADAGVTYLRVYPDAPNSLASIGISDKNPYQNGDFTAGAGTPQQATTLIKHSVWNRYWLEVKLNQANTEFTSWETEYGITLPTGKYHMISYWVWNELTSAAERIVYKAPLQRTIGGQSKTATSVTLSGSTATATIGSHNVDVGDLIWVQGATQTEYNGEFTATAKTSTTVSYTVSGSPASPATGTITVSRVRNGIAAFWWEQNTSANHIPAGGNVTITGTSGTVVPNNTTLTRADGWTFKTQAAVTIAGGTATVAVKASPETQMGGPDGNTAASTALTSTVSGVTSVAVDASGLTGGRYLLNDDLISWSRWFHVLKNYTLPSTPEDDTTIFVKPTGGG